MLNYLRLIMLAIVVSVVACARADNPVCDKLEQLTKTKDIKWFVGERANVYYSSYNNINIRLVKNRLELSMPEESSVERVMCKMSHPLLSLVVPRPNINIIERILGGD